MAVYYAVFGGEYTLVDLHRIHREKDRVGARVAEAREELARSKARADSLEHDPGALERLARERFGLIRDGEVLYRFAEGVGGADGRLDRVDTVPPRR